MTGTDLTVVGVFTDEELDVLTLDPEPSKDPRREREGVDDLVITPYLTTLTADQRDQALRSAGRSLTARGLLLPLPGEGLDGPGDRAAGAHQVQVHDQLAPFLVLRRAAPVVVVLQRATVGAGAPLRTSSASAGGLVRYLFVMEEVCVVEDVTPQGVHTISAASSARTAQLVREFVIPPGARPGAGRAPVLPRHGEGWARLVHRLGDPVLLAEVTVLHPWLTAQETSSRVFLLGPGGCHHTTAESVTGGPFHPAAPDELVQLVQEEIDAATSRVAREMTRAEDAAATMGG